MEKNQEKVVKAPKKGIRLWVFIVSIIATIIVSVGLTIGIIWTQLPKLISNQTQAHAFSKQELFQIEKVFYFFKKN